MPGAMPSAQSGGGTSGSRSVPTSRPSASARKRARRSAAGRRPARKRRPGRPRTGHGNGGRSASLSCARRVSQLPGSIRRSPSASAEALRRGCGRPAGRARRNRPRAPSGERSSWPSGRRRLARSEQAGGPSARPRRARSRPSGSADGVRRRSGGEQLLERAARAARQRSAAPSSSARPMSSGAGPRRPPRHGRNGCGSSSPWSGARSFGARPARRGCGSWPSSAPPR